MRRILSLLAVGLAALGGPDARELSAQSNVAVVYRLLLDEQMVIQSGANTIQAALGNLLNGDDLIATSANTQAAVRFTDDGSLLRVNPNSRVQIRTEGQGNSIVKTLEVEFGELWARIEPQQSEYQFQVQTPAGVAAVKGTEFIVRVEADGTTTVITLEGLLDFFNDVGIVEVPVGFAASAETDQVAPDLQPVQEEQLEDFSTLTEDPDAQAAEESMTIEIPGVDSQGQPKTIVLQIPRSAAGTLLGTGGGE